jgi:hypothetical protein
MKKIVALLVVLAFLAVPSVALSGAPVKVASKGFTFWRFRPSPCPVRL